MIKEIKPGFFEHQGLKVEGVSIAGISSCYYVPDWRVSVDVAQGFASLAGASAFLLTHGHVDHVGGIQNVLSYRALTGQPEAKVYLPRSLKEPIDSILRTWQKIERAIYNYELIVPEFETDYQISPGKFFRPFRGFHRVDNIGYTLVEKRKKLKGEYRNLSRKQIVELKESGKDIEVVESIPLMAFTGDTRREAFEENEFVRRAKILFVETTYIDHQKKVEQAREWGHIHLDELIDMLPDLDNEKIVLTHISSRYKSRGYIEEVISKKIPEKFRDRVTYFPRPDLKD
jgi:ribonuclease Z